MKRYDLILALFLTSLLGGMSSAFGDTEAAAAATTEENPFGFYFDRAQGRYFFDGKKTFSVDRGALDRSRARVEVSVDDEPYTLFNGPVDFKNEGQHTLKYRVVNAFDQVLFQKQFSFYLDVTPPESTVQKPADSSELDGVHYFTSNRGVSLSSYDGLSGVRTLEISLDQKNFTLYKPGTALLEPGRHTVYFRATDNVGNVEPLKSFTYVLSNEAPKTNLAVNPAPVTQGKETYIGVGSLISFNWNNPVVPVKQVAVSVDGDMFVYSKPFRVGTRGPHVVKFYATDYAGNVEKEQTFKFITDDTAPKTVASLEGRVVDYGNVTFVGKDFELKLGASDSESGLGVLQYRFEDGNDKWIPYTDAIKLTKDGHHTIWYRSVDQVGNREEVQKVSVIADMTPPKSTIVSGIPFTRVDNKVYSTFPNVLMFKAEDNLGGLEGVYVSINDGPAEMATGGISLENAAEHKVVYRAVDKLGNEEEPKTIVIHLSKPDVNVKLIAHGRNSAPRVEEEEPKDSKEQDTEKSRRSIASDKGKKAPKKGN